MDAPPIVGAGLRSAGIPLPISIRSDAEEHLRVGLGAVRIHSDAAAAASARAVGAKAYTVGEDIVFGAGEWNPSSSRGTRLLMHELVHVAQQRGASAASQLQVGRPDDKLEQEASRIAADQGHARITGTANSLIVQRDVDSADYQAGYADGKAGAESAPGPRIGDALVDYQEGYAKGAYEASQIPASFPPGSSTQPQSAPDAGSNIEPAANAGQSATLSPTGAQATQVPASFSFGGLPAFRYNLPSVPLAKAHIDTPDVSIDVGLSLIGNVTITFTNAPKGISTDIDKGGWRVEAINSLNGIASGLRINGLGTKEPSFGATLGSQYDQTEIRFIPPNTIAFRGQVRIGYTVPSGLGPIAVQGQPGYELRVTVTPHPRGQPEPVQVTDEEGWFSRNAVPLAVIGGIVLVGIAIALIPATGGGSLVLLAV